MLKTMKLLLIDDNDAQLITLREILKQTGYKHIVTLNDSRQALDYVQMFEPDLMLLDLHMPVVSGFDIMADLKAMIPKDDYFPILALTADARLEIKQKALAGGARDFLTKPYDPTEVKLRIKNLLEARFFYQRLKEHNDHLEAQVRKRTQQLEQTQIEMLVRLAHAAEYRDDESGEHVWRVAHTSWLLARELGLPQEQATMLLRAARLHDVGKIGIPEAILLKPGRLSDAEFEIIKTHTTIGAKLLSGGESPFVRMAELIALTHHERFDGAGYPNGLKGEEIPLESRILAVADTFDALTHDRVHQKAMSEVAAAEIIVQESGTHFDPNVVNAFRRIFERGELTYKQGVVAAQLAV
jgi:putative two-component system response regulator